MQIRNAQSIVASLGKQSIVDGFIPQPIHTFMEYPIWEDDLSQQSCKYTDDVQKKLVLNDTTYKNVLYLRDELKAQYKIEFSLNQTQFDSMTFHEAYEYADALYSERFEGLKLNTNWTEDQIGMVNTT